MTVIYLKVCNLIASYQWYFHIIYGDHLIWNRRVDPVHHTSSRAVRVEGIVHQHRRQLVVHLSFHSLSLVWYYKLVDLYLWRGPVNVPVVITVAALYTATK